MTYLGFLRRLLVRTYLVGATTALLFVVFAPRILLLERQVIDATLKVALIIGVAVTGVATVAVLAWSRSSRVLFVPDAQVEEERVPELIADLHAIPVRAVTTQFLASIVAAALTLHPSIRPATNDAYVQASLVLLASTISGAGAVPLYVMMRGVISEVLETIPIESMRVVLRSFERSGARGTRVRRRLLAALTLPVAFVALGSSLLIAAHARAFDVSVRNETAALVAHASLDRIRGARTGRAEAAQALEREGFGVKFDERRIEAPEREQRGSERVIRVPLSDGHVAMAMQDAQWSPMGLVLVLLALAACALAGAIGVRLGSRFSDDVEIATFGVRTTGVADVMRGTRMRQVTRFRAIAQLSDAVDRLGDVFREFASAQERAIKAREATRRLRGLFLASMSHDLKSPLNAVLGFAALAARAPLAPPQRESVQIIEQRGRELLALIQTILDSARAEAGALPMAYAPAVVGDVAQASALEVCDVMALPHDRVECEVQAGLPEITMDDQRMVQAIGALVQTALRVSDGKVVTVRVALVDDDQLRFTVEVPETKLGDERDDLFSALAHAEKARKFGSAGLGLSLGRAIAERHGGSLDASPMSGSGLSFTLTIPAKRRAPSAT